MTSKLRIVLSFGITAIMLFLALRGVEDFSQIGQVFAQANLWWAAPAVVCSATAYVLRGFRWQRLLAPAKRISFGTVYATLMLGFAANNVLPARVGEIIRAVQMGRKAAISRTLCFSTVAVERVFDGLTLLLFMAIVLMLFPINGDRPELRVVEVVSAAIFLGATLGILTLLLREALALKVLRWALGPAPAAARERLLGLVVSVVGGLKALKDWRQLAVIAGVSIVVWSLEATSYHFVMLALDVPLDPGQRVLAALFLVVFVNLGIMIPSAPGYIGTFQLFAKLALSAFNVNAAIGLSVAILSHAIQYFLVTGIGIVVFAREHLSLNQLVTPPTPSETLASDSAHK